METAESLLKQAGINIDHQNQDGYTTIMKAAEVKDVDTLKILLNEYFNVGCITTSASPIDEHKTHEHILTETVNCKGENVHQVAEKCGIGSAFQLLLELARTKISPLELAMRANDIKSLHIFLDCDFIYAKMKEYLHEVFAKMFQTCITKHADGSVHFNENKIAMIKALLEHGVGVNTTWIGNFVFYREAGRTRLYHKGELGAIQIAAKSGCFKVLELLLSFKANVNMHDFRSSPLHIAHSHGHTECAELPIQHGASIIVNQVLELAVGQQEPNYVRFLIENYKNELMEHLKSISEIQDILIKSVRKGNLEIIGQILDLGAGINGVKGCGMCPLAESKNGEVAKFLIDRGANVKYSKQTRSDIPLIQVLRYRESTDVCVIEVIKVLLENGASANRTCRNGTTPLMLAAVREGSMSVMQLLLDHGAELSERDGKGNTALILAVMVGCVKNVPFLLQFIKDGKELINIQNDEILTVLMLAMRPRDSTTIKELIEAGCDVNCQNNDGLSPLMLAAQCFSKNAMCVLLDSGAEVNAVSKEDNTKTALTHLLYNPHMLDDYFSCLGCLLDRGASSSYLATTALHNMIVAGDLHVIPKLIRCGLGPVCVLLSDICSFYKYDTINTRRLRSLAYEVGTPIHWSPLYVALCVGNSALARFFVGNLFLTHSDVFLLGHNERIRHHLTRMNDKECLDILTEVTAQPMTLFNLSFVAVSTAVGATPGREIRVNKLPVPQIIKDKLLFKKQDVALTVSEDVCFSFENLFGCELYSESDDYGSYSSDSD